MELFSLAFTFFIIADPIGIFPVVAGLIKDFPVHTQRKIIFRESFFALVFAIFFQFFGEKFLQIVGIESYAVSVAGGILLFFIALQLVFPVPQKPEKKTLKKEPFLVPIAVPLITGGALISSIFMYSALYNNPWLITWALILAWVGVVPILLAAPYLQKLLGARGLKAIEQFMGLILFLISTELIVKGLKLFLLKT